MTCNDLRISSGWWFGTWLLWFSIYWEFHPTDFHIFRGVGIPPTSYIILTIPQFQMLITLIFFWCGFLFSMVHGKPLLKLASRIEAKTSPFPSEVEEDLKLLGRGAWTSWCWSVLWCASPKSSSRHGWPWLSIETYGDLGPKWCMVNISWLIYDG
jgi:hypothetical protein